MIQLYSPDSGAILIAVANIAMVKQAHPSSAWHGRNAYITTFSGEEVGVSNTVADIEKLIAAAKQTASA